MTCCAAPTRRDGVRGQPHREDDLAADSEIHVTALDAEHDPGRAEYAPNADELRRAAAARGEGRSLGTKQMTPMAMPSGSVPRSLASTI